MSTQVQLPKGFSSAGTAAGIKPEGVLDMALIYSASPASAAGVFTTNQVVAAPVKLCRMHLENPRAHAIIMNSGVANACTGEPGMQAAQTMAAETAAALGIQPDEVLVCSTGKIGPQLPLDKISSGIEKLVTSASSAQVTTTAEAMMTTDTRPKVAMRTVSVAGQEVVLTGFAKGAGMIEPNMATMLAYLLTDAALEPHLLQKALKQAVDQSFNRISIDGDQSTNDSVLLLANGAAGVALDETIAEWDLFVEALQSLCFELAMMIVHDGEGADRFVTVEVTQAQTEEEADGAARAVANSMLNKTAWAGTYPDWGRIMDAIGYSKAQVQEEKIQIYYGDLQAVSNGMQSSASHEQMVKAVSEKELLIRIELGVGEAAAVIYTCNCTEAYVRINY